MNPLDHQIFLAPPLRIAASGWLEHVPFGMYLVEVMRPRMLVELGTHNGVSYCAFCQAVLAGQLDTRCYAVDTWEGDPQAGFYGPEVLADLRAHHDPLYGGFSRLVQSTFDAALDRFAAGDIDLLHIDGYHAYQAAKRDFEAWLPKLSDRGVVLLHDIGVREHDFGTWRLWNEIKSRYSHFEFTHGNGLGVALVGDACPRTLLEISRAPESDIVRVRSFFHQLGQRVALRHEIDQLSQAVDTADRLKEDQAVRLAEQEKTIDSLSTENEAAIRALKSHVAARDQILYALIARVNEQATTVETLNSDLHDKTQALLASASQVTRVTRQLGLSEQSAKNLAAQVADWEQHWVQVQNTRAWRLAMRWRDVRDGFRSRPGPFPRSRRDECEGIAEIERVAWSANFLEMDGWALTSRDGAPPRTISIVFDGAKIGETRCNLSRHEIAKRFPANPAAWSCGFHYFGPAPQSSGEPTELHNVSIEFVDGAGRQAGRTASVARAADDPGMPEVSDKLEELAELFSEVETRTGLPPAVLDWHTGLRLAEEFPQQIVFLPTVSDDGAALPYLDGSVDVVVVSGRHDSRLSEARRVAMHLLVTIDDPSSQGDNSPHGVTPLWLSAGTSPQKRSRSLPSTSIIIPAHNNLSYTDQCLRQVLATLPQTFRGEIIVVDDGSTEETTAALRGWAQSNERIHVLRNDVSLGFVHSCNRGAQAATGEALLFLNNDTLPQPRWLPPLLRILRDREDAGAVGGKLLYPDGSLQEAGASIFLDGSGYNFGNRDFQIDAPLYSYVRAVDYCSAALLATPRTLFEDVGGFDERYAPAYYEDTDYCFSLQDKGYRVYFQPESVVIHFEGVTAGTGLSHGVKRFQEINRIRFAKKWQQRLARQPLPPAQLDLETMYTLAVHDVDGGSSIP